MTARRGLAFGMRVVAVDPMAREAPEGVAARAGELKDVVHTEDLIYTCSEPGQAAIQNAIREKGLDRVVVAACSVRDHEETFRGVMTRAADAHRCAASRQMVLRNPAVKKRKPYTEQM